MKIIKNACYGGFGLSDKACEWLIENKGWKVTEYEKDGNTLKDAEAELILAENSFFNKYLIRGTHDELRVNKDVIECVETLGEKANGQFASLKIEEIPDDVEWYIDDYDGIETIHEVHDKW